LITECSCPDYANPCKHVAAVHYILGERFDQDPFMLFRLRGRTQEQVLEGLRARRAGAAGLDDEAEEEVEPVIPLAETIGNFWDLGQPLSGIKTNVKPPVTELPVLKRLGQPAFLSDDLLKTLGPAYEAITKAAVATAFSDKPETEGEETDTA
jgi:uncharacterized Zn finger protein